MGDHKTQENAAGAIGNLVSNQRSQSMMAAVVRFQVIERLLRQIGHNAHLCVIRNCLYSLSNCLYATECKRVMLRFAWRQILRDCLDKYARKDPFVKKCAFKILHKMEAATANAAAVSGQHSRAVSERSYR